MVGRQGGRDGVGGRRVRVVLAVVVLGAIAFVGWTKLERRPPTAALVHPLDVVGLQSTVDVRLADAGTGLASARVELESGGTVTELAREIYPSTSWRGSDVHDTTISVPLDPRGRKIAEGPAIVRVFADDHSWLRWFRTAGPLLEQPITIDLSPPTVEVLSQQHYLKLGGVDFMLYKVSPDAVRSGVQVGPYFFPGAAGLFEDPQIRAAFFAVPQDLDTKTTAKAVAEDAAGNRREVPFHTVVKPRRFAETTMKLDDDFLGRKVPDLLAASGEPSTTDLLAGYLTINRSVRAQSETRIKDATRNSAPTQLWEGPFLRQPNSAPLSGFADRRTYVYGGEPVDHQTHLGFDLASLRQAEVPAGNSGRIVFAGPLGIYGDAVIIDHGLGIFSLYAHLSAITVKVGQEVHRGEVVGRTGETGLAGGDHLHFSIMLYGVHVDPIEWWDGKWIRDHVTAKLDAYPRPTAPAPQEP